jgi:hypothetical protein
VLVALIVGAEPGALLGLDVRDLAATILALLLARPLALTAFAAALAVAGTGASVFSFLLKGGAVALLVQAEREAGPVEEPPLHFAVVATGAVFTVERFIERSRALFPRFLRLGAVLLAAYALSGLALALVAFGRDGEGWFVPIAATVLFVAWITAVNLLYLLSQIVMAAEGCGVGVAIRRAMGFVRRALRTVAAVCVAILALVLLASFASLVAATALGLIGFVPFVGLAVLPLQQLALDLRGLVLQYIALASIGAYSALYRGQASESAAPADSVAVSAARAEAG